jgi:four helix bundle protein
MQNGTDNFKKEFKQRLYNFVLKLIKFIGSLDKKDPVCWTIADQLIRSGTSILSNYIEGQSSSSKKEFTNYFSISLKSANESKVWIALLRDSDRCNRSEADWFLDELSEIAKIFASSILTLKGKR